MLYIVHLSDFHFYDHSNWYNMKDALIKKLKEKEGLDNKGKTLLVITGDLHDFRDKNYDSAKQLIVEIKNTLNLEISEDVFVVPGNHDKVYSDDSMTKMNQFNAMEVTQNDWKKLENDNMIKMLLSPFSSYNDMCKELGIYKDENLPATVHVRTWRNKLNVFHLNTALVADGKVKKDQVIDIKTLTKLRSNNTIPSEYPSIAIGHNEFYDLDERIQLETMAVFDAKNVRAYLCGDKHKFKEKGITKHIALKNKFGSKTIPNIVCGRCTTDEDDNYSDFGFYIHCWNENTGKVDLEKYVWDDKHEQNDFTLIVDKNAYELSIQRLDIEPADMHRFKTIKSFEDNICALAKNDGMMKCLSKSFQDQITNNAITLSELEILNIIQDEYKKVYDQFYAYRRVDDTEGLDRILSSPYVMTMEKNEETPPLIITYLQFVRADRKYFTKDFDGAIQDYQAAYEKICAQYKSSVMPTIDKEKCAYLLNSIAWTHVRRSREGDIRIALEWYKQLFDEYKDIDTYTFSWRYRRNYGVCLEIVKEYMPAIEQYGKGIKNYSEAKDNGDMHEYKLFLTYCSAMMKYWDTLTQKTSGEWLENTRETYKNRNEYLNDKTFVAIDAYLTLANEKYKKLDSKSALPDYYNQLSKMLTYKLMINSEKSISERDIDDIKKKLIILESIDANAIGQHYVKRDFNYALYELASDAKVKEDSYQNAWKENEIIGERGDAKEFRDMLLRKKDKDDKKTNDNDKDDNK